MKFDEHHGSPTLQEREMRLTPDERYLIDIYQAKEEERGANRSVRQYRQLPTLEHRFREDTESYNRRKLNARRKDQQLAERLRKSHENTGDPRGTFMEQFILEEASASQLFGEARVFQTTDYDDLVGGVDMVLEWPGEQEGESITIAVDATASRLKGRIENKVHKHMDGADVKYFASNIDTNRFGQPVQRSLEKVPYIVLGLDTTYIGDIAKSARAAAISKEVPDAHGNTKTVSDIPEGTFSDHPIRLLLLAQASVQMESLVRSKVADTLDDMLQNPDISELHKALKELRTYTGKAPVDDVAALFNRNDEGHAKLQREVLGDVAWNNLQHWIIARERVQETVAELEEKSTLSEKKRAEIWKRASTLYGVVSGP